jgi:hypothetical protein
MVYGKPDNPAPACHSVIFIPPDTPRDAEYGPQKQKQQQDANADAAAGTKKKKVTAAQLRIQKGICAVLLSLIGLFFADLFCLQISQSLRCRVP